MTGDDKELHAQSVTNFRTKMHLEASTEFDIGTVLDRLQLPYLSLRFNDELYKAH